MDQNIRAMLQSSTFFYFLIILSLTTVSQLTTMMAILFADLAGKQLLVAATVVVSGFFGAFGIIRVLTKLHLLMHELDTKTAATTWGKEMQAIPISVLRFVFAGLVVIVAIIQLITIYG